MSVIQRNANRRTVTGNKQRTPREMPRSANLLSAPPSSGHVNSPPAQRDVPDSVYSVTQARCSRYHLRPSTTAQPTPTSVVSLPVPVITAVRHRGKRPEHARSERRNARWDGEHDIRLQRVAPIHTWPRRIQSMSICRSTKSIEACPRISAIRAASCLIVIVADDRRTASLRRQRGYAPSLSPSIAVALFATESPAPNYESAMMYVRQRVHFAKPVAPMLLNIPRTAHLCATSLPKISNKSRAGHHYQSFIHVT